MKPAETPLVKDFATVLAVLNGEKSIFDQDENGFTAIHIATKFGWINLMNKLIEKDDRQIELASIHRKITCRSPLCIAVCYTQLAAMELLLSKGANPNGNKEPIIYNALKHPDGQCLKILLKYGINLNDYAKYVWFESPVHQVCAMGFVSTLKVLIENGANIMGYRKSNTPFHAAILHNNIEVLKYLLGKFNEIEMDKILKKKYVSDLLNYAVKLGSLISVKTLFRLVIDQMGCINYLTKSAVVSELLHSAINNTNNRSVFHSSYRLLCYLIEKGFDVKPCSVPLNSDFLTDYYQEHPQKLEFVRRCYNDNNNLSISLLGNAVLNGQTNCMEKLIRNGVEVNPSSYNVVCPLLLAVLMGRQNIYDILLENGAEVNYLVPFKDERVPVVLFGAFMKPNRILFSLLKHGANPKLLTTKNLEKIRQINPANAEWVQLLMGVFSGKSVYMADNPEKPEKKRNISILHNKNTAILNVDRLQFCISKEGNFCDGFGFTTLQHLCRTTIVQAIMKTNTKTSIKDCVAKLHIPNQIKRYLRFKVEF